MLDLPAEELPWGVEPPERGGLVHLLRLDKVPIARCWRSVVLPVQNQLIRRPVRIWTPEGADADALAAIAAGQAQRLRLPVVDPDEMDARHEHELALSPGHLRSVRDRYWQDRDWRRAHSGGDRRPEDHLWEAVNGYVELLDATQWLPHPFDRGRGAVRLPERSGPHLERARSGHDRAGSVLDISAPAPVSAGDCPGLDLPLQRLSL